MVAPTGDELAEVAQLTRIGIDQLKIPLDDDERPRVEKEEGITSIIVRIPIEETNGETQIATVPLGIFVGVSPAVKCIVTVTLHDSPVLNDFRNCKLRGFTIENRSFMVLRMLFKMNYHFLRYLNRIEKEVDKLGISLSKSFKNEEIIRLFSYQKALVYFNNSLVGNAQVLEKISKGNVFKLSDEEKELVEDILIDSQQAKETTKIFSDILSNTMGAYGSIVSNNVNLVMKLLASVTIILSFPTMVASFYGMNVGLPMQNSPIAFFITIGISLAISICAVIIFWNKKWL